jgi:hypothetical protein
MSPNGTSRSFRLIQIDEYRVSQAIDWIANAPLPFKNSVSISRSLLTPQSRPRIEVGTVQDFLFRSFYS